MCVCVCVVVLFVFVVVVFKSLLQFQPRMTESIKVVVFVFTGNLILDIFRAPIQVTIGLLYGIISGLLLWFFPTKHFVSPA